MRTTLAFSRLLTILATATFVFAATAIATPVTFHLAPTGGANSVSVAGSFNGWSTDAAPMTDADQDGVWEVLIDLPAGSHQYKFVVDGTEWLTDTSASEFVDDGFGGQNSVLTVGTEPLVVGTTTGGDAPDTAAAGSETVSAGAATSVTFRYQPVIGGVESVSVAGSFNEWDPAANPLQDVDEDGVWETEILLPRGKHTYKFVVNGTEWFPDDFAAASEPDGYGGENSLVQVADQPVITGTGGNATAGAAEETTGLREVTFRHRVSSTPGQVALAGTFNDWTVGKALLSDEDGDGEYTTVLLLSPGDYQYKFVIDGTWTTDKEHADEFTEDGFGGQNSIIHVDDRFPSVDLGLGDGRIFEVGITHGQTGTELNNLGGGSVELSFRAHRGDIEGVELLVSGDGRTRRLPLEVVETDAVYDYYRATVADAGNRFTYLAAYTDGGTTLYLGSDGFSAQQPAPHRWFMFDGDRFPPFETPDWVKDAVIYQIFPERFRNGNPGNDPDFTEWYYEGKSSLPSSGKTNEEFYHLVDDWYDVAGLSVSPYRTDGKPDYFSFYGGDIAGAREGLDYLQDLGVTAVYFNPVFAAKSNHKYDCCSYLEIDPHFGTNEEFQQFVKDAHQRGIRIILDIVFNHTGNCHYAFQDAVKNGPQSEYYTWYEFKQWPLPSGTFKSEDYYFCWWGFGDLPDLNFDLDRANPSENGLRERSEATVNEPLMAHLMEVVQFWIGDMDCDGVRLDVANEVPFWFWRDFNKKVKGIKSDAYIVGEIWGNASDWIGPDLYDATMNYAFFRDPVNKFLGQGSGTAVEFDRSLAAGRSAYPTQSVQAMMNLVGSHDTVRFLTQVGNNPNRLMLASMFAFTYVGAPHIYYGDEIGMTGGKDPDCRRPFLWNWNEDPQRVALHDHYRKLARIRAAYPSLRRGAFRTLYARGPVYVYERTIGDERIVVALNAGKSRIEAEVGDAFKGPGVNLMTDEAVSLTGVLNLAPESGLVLKTGGAGSGE